MEESNFPKKAELLEDLQKLKEVSALNEELTKNLPAQGQPPEELKKKIEQCASEQSRIVDKFISLSKEQESLEQFKNIINNIDNKTKELEQTNDEEKINLLKKEILKEIEEWIKCLEYIIRGVINQAKE